MRLLYGISAALVLGVLMIAGCAGPHRESFDNLKIGQPMPEELSRTLESNSLGYGGIFLDHNSPPLNLKWESIHLAVDPDNKVLVKRYRLLDAAHCVLFYYNAQETVVEFEVPAEWFHEAVKTPDWRPANLDAVMSVLPRASTSSSEPTTDPASQPSGLPATPDEFQRACRIYANNHATSALEYYFVVDRLIRQTPDGYKKFRKEHHDDVPYIASSTLILELPWLFNDDAEAAFAGVTTPGYKKQVGAIFTTSVENIGGRTIRVRRSLVIVMDPISGLFMK